MLSAKAKGTTSPVATTVLSVWRTFPVCSKLFLRDLNVIEFLFGLLLALPMATKEN